MSRWTKDNDADLATWIVEMAITDIGLSFDESPHLTMGRRP